MKSTTGSDAVCVKRRRVFQGRAGFRSTQRRRCPAGGLPGAVALAVAAAFFGGAAAQEGSITDAAADLPAEIRLLSGVDLNRDLRWTRIGVNPKAQEQEALHPELNAIAAVWHCSLASGRHAFRFDFTRPFNAKRHVFHLYVKADGRPETGRVAEGVMGGVDYMFTLSDGYPGLNRSAWNHFMPDGSSQAAPHLAVVKDARLYLSADMTVAQKANASVFEFMISSYVPEQIEGGYRAVANSGIGFTQAVSQAEPPRPAGADADAPLINPALRQVNGAVPGWQILTGRRPLEASLTAGSDGALVMEPLYSPEGLAQSVSLTPGHYLFRALAKTNVYQVHLIAVKSRMPIPVSADLRWVELPFCIERIDGTERQSAQVGFRYMPRPATGNASRLPASLTVKRVELHRLGDTVLRNRWAETIPVNPIHGLERLNAAPQWNRPGKVVFRDSFIGTEMWLMTQEGRIDHSYVGHPDFSLNGEYLHIGVRRSPRGLLRTDGTARYLNDGWGGLIWLFPWMEERLPAGADPADWIVTATNATAVDLVNVVTEETHRIALPSRPGWQIAHYPGFATYGGRGPRIPAITHETLVWFSEERTAVALSDADGGNFRAFDVKSISPEPAGDTVTLDMSSVGGKAGDNWRDALDREGRRYFLFEINRDNLPDHPANPYQVWAVCLSPGDTRGLLRVTPHPNATVTEFVTSQTGMTKLPSANWWDFAAGFPWSGDNGILRLEDGTLIHMSSLGMHSSCLGGDTVTVNDPHSGEVRFVGTFPRFDRITWPHEYRRDRDFAVIASHAEPASPLVMIDLENTTMWAVALTNFHDYSLRYRTRWDKDAYHKPMFRPAPTFSPDFTKVSFFSAMLTGDHPDRKWGDVYVAVVRYPQPPENLRADGSRLTWEPPPQHTEIKGYRLYRSDSSGLNYARTEHDLITDTQAALPPDSTGFYVLTSVEYSGLESRVFSNEVRIGPVKGFRHVYQAETGTLTAPMTPVFEPADAAGAYAAAIRDPELLYRERLKDRLTGTVGLRADIPDPGPIRILARVRGMSRLERSTYMTGWPAKDDDATGAFAVRVNGIDAGSIPVAESVWTWSELDRGAVDLAAGPADIHLSTGDAGIAVDCILVTDDPGFAPRGRVSEPEALSAAPDRPRTAPFSADDAARLDITTPRVKLTWEPVDAPQGVAHYNVYRGDTPGFEADRAALLGSPSAPVFYDCGLQTGQKVYYRLRAVDAWGNRSPASPPLEVTTADPGVHAAFHVEEKTASDRGTTFVFDAAPSHADTGRIDAWNWIFGDGAAAEGNPVTHTYATAGTYTVRLTVATDRGEGAATETALYVRPPWIQPALDKGAVWIEAEAKTAEGDGESRLFSGRVNASGQIVTYWEKDPGHWLEWTVTIPETADYSVILKYASGSARILRGCRFDGEYPDRNWTTIAFPGTGGFSSNADNWKWKPLAGQDRQPLRVRLTKGQHTLRLENVEGGMALDAFMIVPAGALPKLP